MRAQIRARRTLVWAALLALLAAVLCFVPLFNALGYEFSFVLAIASSAAAADLGGALTRRIAAQAETDPGDASSTALLPGARPLGRPPERDLTGQDFDGQPTPVGHVEIREVPRVRAVGIAVAMLAPGGVEVPAG